MKLALVALVACGSSKPAAPPEHAEPASVARSTPAPSITWGEHAFETPVLPAIARAGEVAVVAIRESDGGRGWPNLRIEVRDRSDRTIQTIRIMESNEYEALFPDDKPNAELQRRLVSANRELATLHGVHDLVALKPLEIQKPGDDALPHFAIGDGLDVDWSRARLQVYRHNVDRPFRTVDGHTWLARAGARCAQCPPCDNPAYLHAVYMAAAIDAIVVEIAYRGTDTCWEPGNQLHYVTW